jgi:hypothetical protein
MFPFVSETGNIRIIGGIKLKKTTCCAAAVVLLISIVIAGCSSKSAAAMTAPDVLGKSYDQMQTVKSFHFILEHSEGGTPIGSGIIMTKAEGDVVKPDKLQATITGTAMGMTVEVKLVSKTMMTNPLNNKWEELTDTFKVLGVFDPGTGIAAIIKDIANPTSLKDEKVGEVLCYHIKGDIMSQTLEPITGVTAKDIPVGVEVWVDQEGLLVQQIKLTGKITDTEQDGIIRTLTISNYDKDVEIKLPE